MSLADLLSNAQGLLPFSGESVTTFRTVDETQIGTRLAQRMDFGTAIPVAATAVGVVGSHVDVRSVGAIGKSTFHDITPEAVLRAASSASAGGIDIDFNLALKLNDQVNILEILPRPQSGKVTLHDASVTVSSEDMGRLSWGYQENVFGGAAIKCGVMPGLGVSASPHKPQFKYTSPDFSGVSVEVALSQQVTPDETTRGALNDDIVLAAGIINLGVQTKFGTEIKASYDLSEFLTEYGANVKVGVEMFDQTATRNFNNLGVGALITTAGAMKGSGYFLDADVSGATICMGKSKTKGLGGTYQNVGGIMTDAVDAALTGRREFEHTYSSLKYTIPSAYPLDLSVHTGKTTRKGLLVTGTAESGTPMENKRSGFSVSSNVSDDLSLALVYDKISSAVGTQLVHVPVSEAKVMAFQGRYKF